MILGHWTTGLYCGSLEICSPDVKHGAVLSLLAMFPDENVGLVLFLSSQGIVEFSELE